jgi:adenylate kinase family enzyme
LSFFGIELGVLLKEEEKNKTKYSNEITTLKNNGKIKSLDVNIICSVIENKIKNKKNWVYYRGPSSLEEAKILKENNIFPDFYFLINCTEEILNEVISPLIFREF